MAWWLIMCSSPNPDAAFECFIEQLGHDDPKLRLWAAMCLGRTRFFLSDTQLATALDTIRASPAQASESAEMLRLEHAAAIDHQLRSRAASDHHDKLRLIAEMPLSPEAITAAVEGGSINELIALHRGLGIRRTQLFDADETLEAAIEVRTTELCIDRDEAPDCILLVSNRHWRSGESNIHYEAIVLLRSEDPWSLAGMIDLSNAPAAAPSFRTVSASDGERWLVVRRDSGSSPDGSYFIQQDAWYRVKRGGLRLEQAVMPRAFSSSRFHQTLEPSDPKVIRRTGSYHASYDISSTISLAVPEPDGSNRLVPIAAERGTFEYPLGVSDTNLGNHASPGPWEGRDCWWAILEDPDILVVHKAELLTLARSEDPDIRAALRATIDEYLAFLAPTPEIIEIRQALDEP
jgi:hypothetical protein